MDAADKRMLEREALRTMIQQWNANRLDLFELSEPNDNLEFHGVMRFYFQDSGQKIATKCIRVASDATVSDVIETLIEKFRPDMRMLSLGSYSLWETHGPDDERKLEPHEKPLLVQLNWHTEDREGRFLLKCLTNNEMPLSTVNEKADQNFKRKLSKREKKELKKKEKLSRLKSDTNDENRPVAEKLYTELPETSFTRSISNPEAVMRRRRQQKLERKLQQFRSKDGGPDTGGTLKIYGSSLCPDVPYKTLLLSVGDSAANVVREMLDKYGLSRHDPQQYCIVQVDTTDNTEYILDDDECPLAIVMTHHHHSSIMFHVRRRPADAQPRRRKKKAGGSIGSGGRPGTEPALLEVAPDGSALENGRRLRITEVVEVGSGNGTALQLYGPSIQPRHCVIAPADGGGHTVTPLHADAHVYLNGRRVTQTQRLQHGCLLKFGRVSTFRFVDPMQENLLNRNLSQSQHFGSGSIYDRSPTSPGNTSTMSPNLDSHGDTNANTTDDYTRTMSPVSQDTYYRDDNTSRSYIDDNTRSYRDDDVTSRPYIDDNQRPYRDDDPTRPYNNNTLKLDNESLVISQQAMPTGDDYIADEQTGSVYNEHDQNATPNRTVNSQYKDNYETTFDLDGNVETKSICSAKSGGSGHDSRMSATVPTARPGQEAILPAVLEFPEQGQAQFLAAVITRLDPHAPAFKLAPVYTLYLCARYRASTHYRPELTPTERAHKLTAFLHHVATLIHETVQLRCNDSAAQAFWMANASELLHFLKCDRHISSFSTQAQDLLPTTVQNAFSNLVSCFQEELSRALATLSNPAIADATEATAPTLQTLAAAMVLLRRCRVNAALTIQLFSHLFHYINAVCFNKLVTEPGTISARWGAALSARFALLAAWAERQGLEIAADCHLARTHQAARLIQGEYRTAEEARAALSACFKLNSVQVRALLSPLAAAEVVEAAVAHARALSDELHRSDGREIRLEESVWLGTGLLIPGDGFSAEVVRGVPPGLAEFVAPLQRGGLCRLAHQPHALGAWTVYMGAAGPPRAPDPRLAIVQLNKNTNGMGLSIVAAKGYGQNKLGIYIKSVVAGGAAAADGRLAAGDQLLSVDGQSLVGITQEKAAEYLMRTGPVVTLEVAKQGAVLHGLATLLHQPTYNQKQAGAASVVSGPGGRRMSERDLPSRLAAEPVKPSKSTPALHAHPAPLHPHSATLSPPQSGPGSPNAWANKSRSSHNLSAPQHDTFYQNLSTVHHQQHMLQDRWSSLRSSTGSNRPQSAHFSAAATDQTPEAHMHQQMSARAAKLAEMTEEVNRRMQQQQSYQQKPLPIQPQVPPHHNHQQMVNQSPMQGQIPSGVGYASGHQPPLSPPPVHNPHLYHNQTQPQPQMPPQIQAQPPSQTQQQMSSQMQQQIPPQMPQQMPPQMQQQMPPQMQQQMPPQMQQQMPPQMQQQMPPQLQQQIPSQLQQTPSQMQQQMSSQMQQQTQQQLQLQSQRYEWHPPGPPSPQRTQPPVAPKPQNTKRSEKDLEDQFQSAQQMQSVQPDDERYVASALEPPAVSVYPAGSAPGARGPPAHNPWQREERERQAEARRQAARARRDATIAQLVSLGSSRTPVQNQQLRALQLERDFERRATQHEEDQAAADGGVEEEEASEPQTEPEPRTPHPPKSILKTNTRQDLANGYNGYPPEPQQQQVQQSEESRLSELAGSMCSLSAGAPPPPARGSSFAVMAGRVRQHDAPPQPQQQQQQQPLSQQAPLSPVSSGRDKRVSFHERAGAPPAPPSTSPPPLENAAPPAHAAPAAHAAPPAHAVQSGHTAQSVHISQQTREDPDRFIEEAENMLAGGISPGAGVAAPAHTPGVIGAQEVYRDPRTRRLAEQQARAATGPVPEQLSFREKMKMFALEAGDPSTPKDKVKISRAQRDIDAVH